MNVQAVLSPRTTACQAPSSAGPPTWLKNSDGSLPSPTLILEVSLC